MTIDETISQDPMDHFTRTVMTRTIDWSIYFHDLKPEQKADADQLLYDMCITTPSQPGTYKVMVQRAGIHSNFGLPTIDGEIAHYNEESEAKDLASYINSIRTEQQKRITPARFQNT